MPEFSEYTMSMQPKILMFSGLGIKDIVWNDDEERWEPVFFEEKEEDGV